jgi:hypothetical protein
MIKRCSLAHFLRSLKPCLPYRHSTLGGESFCSVSGLRSPAFGLAPQRAWRRGRNKPQNVGAQLREARLNVTKRLMLHLVCNVTLAATTSCKLQHEEQLWLDLWFLLFNIL